MKHFLICFQSIIRETMKIVVVIITSFNRVRFLLFFIWKKSTKIVSGLNICFHCQQNLQIKGNKWGRKVNVKEVEKDGSIAHLHMQYYLYLLLTPKPSFNLLNLPYSQSKGWGTSKGWRNCLLFRHSPKRQSKSFRKKRGKNNRKN